MSGVSEEVKKTEKKDKKKRKKEGIEETERIGETATTRDQMGMRAYEMYEKSDVFSSRRKPHRLFTPENIHLPTGFDASLRRRGRQNMKNKSNMHVVQ